MKLLQVGRGVFPDVAWADGRVSVAYGINPRGWAEYYADGTLVANLGYAHVAHPHPMFHGDTLYMTTEVVETRESRSRPDQGIVRFRHTGRNQNGVVVIEFERTALIKKQA